MIIKKKKNLNTSENKAQPQETRIEEKKSAVSDFNSFDSALGSIDDRQERRRGDRRRGYRRVDDRNLISRAQEEANTLRERAAKDGFQHGLMTAQQESLNLRNAIVGLLNAKAEAMQLAANDIAFIAIKVAEKIIKTEVACDETIVLNIVSEVLKEIGNGESRIIIKTNPYDTDIVRQNLPKIFPYGGFGTNIIVLPDREIESGSCKVETSSGMVDANFRTQIELLKKAFNEEF